MVKLKNDINKVHRKAVYAWSYHTKYTYRFCDSRTEKSFYRKKYCQIPFYSRVQAKHILITLYGNNATKYVHFTSGKNLIRDGIRWFHKNSHPYEIYFGDEGITCEVFEQKSKKYKVKRIYHGHLKKYVYPPEFIYDKHRRRYFAVLLQRKRKKGVIHFNQWYRQQFYGSRQAISRKHLQSKRKKEYDAILQEIPSLRSYKRRNRTGDI